MTVMSKGSLNLPKFSCRHTRVGGYPVFMNERSESSNCYLFIIVQAELAV